MPKGKPRVAKPQVAKPPSKPIAMSLFSGAGGDSLGMKRAGYDVQAFSEFKKPAIATHLQAFPSCTLLKNPETDSTDITKIPDEIYVTYRDHLEVLFAGFPCFVKGTLVLTDNGYKPIQDVAIEDKLLTHTGTFQKIVNQQQKEYTGTLYDIKLKYNPEIITATEDHPFYVRKKVKTWNTTSKKYDIHFEAPEWKKASELTMDHYYGMVVNNKSIVPSFDIIKHVNKHRNDTITVTLDQPDQWYMMGYFVGDGWIEDSKKPDQIRDKHTIRFVFHEDHLTIAERIQRVLPITDKKVRSGKSIKYGCSNDVWFAILKKFGKYAHGKCIPEWVQDAPTNLIEEFIAGYMDADGCLKKNGYQITTVSHNLAYGLQRLYLKLGCFASIDKTIRPKTCVIQGRTCNQRDTYQVRYVPTTHYRYTNFIESNYVWYAASKVTTRNVENEPVYNFEVETDNSYIVQNAIVHNCQGFSHGGKKKMDDPRNEMVHEFARAAQLIRPTYIMGENVAGLLSRKGKDPVSNNIRPVIDIIRDVFTRIGYHITYNVIKATEAGVPQERKRLIIIGTKVEMGYPHMPWDNLVEPPSIKHARIRTFLESHLEGAVEFKKENLPENVSPHYWISTTETEPTGKPHPNLLRLEGGIRNRSTKEKEKDGDTSSLVIQGGLISFGVRKSSYHGQILDPDLPSKTIICTYGVCPRLFVGLYNPQEDKYWVRCLSVKELAQIQGFPVDYPWQGNEKEIITQIGNAVPPRLCEQIVLSLPNIVYKDTPQQTTQSQEKEDEDEEED
jgi:DNA-cytosine methyltransferase